MIAFLLQLFYISAMKPSEIVTTPIPTQWVGPILLKYLGVTEEIDVPLATYESPLWASTARGAKVSRMTDGINVSVIRDVMSRSILLEAPRASDAVKAVRFFESIESELAAAVNATTRFGRWTGMHYEIVGNLIYLRIEMETGDAAGHNMVTGAAEAVVSHILERCPELRYGSLSANYCTDKKVSAVNGILGRGKSVIAECRIPAEVCLRVLRTKPQAIADLNLRKNLLGTALAGGLRSANAHVANLLLATYLATGQDAANIIEGSQAFTLATVQDEDLIFSVSLPNMIVGTVGNGKDLAVIEETLERLGCREDRQTGENAKRLAAIMAATVLCGELSLMAALTHPEELMRSHRKLERQTHG